MAEQVLSDNFLELRRDLRIQTLITQVRTFNGEGHKNFRSWVKDMKRVRLTVGQDEERTRLVALSTLRGQASEYLTREVAANANISWPEILDTMNTRFSDLADTQYALQTLKRLKQKEGENVQAFSERMLELAEEAFPPADMNHNMVQRQLVDIFIDGVKDNSIAKRLIRMGPATLQAAVRVALEEQVTARQYQMRRREEPMEVDSASKSSRLDHVEESLADLTKELKEVLALTRARTEPNAAPAGQGTGQSVRKTAKSHRTPDGRIKCFYCDWPGHKKADCRKFKRDQAAKGNEN